MIDSTVAQLEPLRYFIRSYDAEGQLKGEFGLTRFRPVYVGRALGCQVDLVEPSISRRHCAFQYKDLTIDALGNANSGFMIYDLKSSHGTFLNDKRIPAMENIKLEHKDKITLGQSPTIFKFWDSEHETLDAAATEAVVPQTETPHNKEKSVDEAMLAQQPSSTSQPEEPTRSEDGFFVRYMKALDQLSDISKEFEEMPIQIPHSETRKKLAKKFMQQNAKLLTQTIATTTILTEVLSTNASPTPETAPKKGRKRRNNDTTVAKETPEIPRKRGRRSKKQQPEVEPILSNSEEQINSSLGLYNGTARFESDLHLDENDPIAIINGPLLQDDDFPVTVKESSILLPENGGREKRVIKLPKKYDPESLAAVIENSIPKRRGRPPRSESLQSPSTIPSSDELPKRRRGRQPKSALANNLPAEQPEDAPIPKKKGRKPKALAALPSIEVNGPKKNKAELKAFDPLAMELTHDELLDGLPPSPPSELIAINNSFASNFNNGNYRALNITIRQPMVLLRKLTNNEISEGITPREENLNVDT